MKIKVSSEQAVLQEGEVVLFKHLGPAKAARFLAAWRQGAGDYLQTRKGLFAGETVETLYEKVLKYQQNQ